MLMILSAEQLLNEVAGQIAEPLRPHIVVIGLIASAWHFQELLGDGAVATKDIDLVLRPAVDAQATAANPSKPTPLRGAA